MDGEDKRKVRIGITVALFTILLYLGLQNLDILARAVGFVVRLFSPFLFGICFAFVLNILMRFFENRVFRRLNEKNSSKWQKIRRPFCLVLTILLFLGLVTALIWFLIPQLIQSVTTLGNNMSGYIESFQNWLNVFLENFGVSADINEAITDFLAQFSDSIVNYITRSVPRILGTAMSITSGIVNVFMGFVISIYMLAAKESLTRNVKRVIYAFLPQKAADYLAHIYKLTNKRFVGFVSGQLTEAFILGALCFIGMNIFGMQYSLLISIIIGLTNIVPIIGPILGTIPGALIMLMIDPMKALWFVVFIIILQQFESNLIYPRVVGTSVGLPGLWVLFAVLIGGNLFGLPGVLLGVPVLSVLYVLLAESVIRRLQEKKQKI